MSEELREAIAEQVLALHPDADKPTWGREYLKLARSHADPEVDQWINERLLSVLGRYVDNVRDRREKRQRNERLMSRGISTTTGRPINPSLSVRRKDGRPQGGLWVEASPLQYVEAVFREDAVVRGRGESNAVRMKLAELIQRDEALQELPALKDVCAELDIDPDTLGLEELPA